MIRIRTLGECLIELDGAPVRPEATLVFAVLLYLGTARGKRVERELLCSLLWPRSNAARRKHNLRQILYKLNRSGVTVGGASGPLSLPAGDVWLDFEDAPLDGSGDEGAEWWNAGVAPALPGYLPRFSAPFRAWLDELRARVESSARRRIVAALGRARRDGAWEKVERLARICLQFDPLNEEATLALAESTALAGSKSRAIAMLDAYVSELGPVAAPAARLPAEVLRRRISDRLPRRVRGRLDVPMIGRDDEMRELAELIARTRAGEAGCCLLHGPPGIGKTRLIQEMARTASLGATVVVTQQAAPDDVNTPGLTLVRLFRALMAQPGSLGVAPDVLAFLKRLTAQGPVPPEAPPPDSSEDALVRATVDLQRALSHELTLVLVLDDAHHADALTRRTLNRAQGCLTDERVLLVLTALDESGALTMTTTRRAVRRLDGPSTLCLARELLERRGAPAAEELAGALATASGGNPFVLREAVLAVTARPDGGTPEGSIEAILQQRCGELTDSARELLLTALILGEHATVAMLLSGTTLSGDVAERALVELEESQILSCEARGAVHVHGLWLKSVEALFPAGQIAARRLRVAQLLETASAQRSDAAELLLSSAEQFQRAGDAGSASTALARGGAAFRDRSLGSAAHAAYRRSASIAPDSDTFERWISQAATAAADAQQHDDLRYILDRFGDRLTQSALLTEAERATVQLITVEFRQMLGGTDAALVAECELLVATESLSAQARLRACLTGIRAAEFRGDSDAIHRFYQACQSLQASPDAASNTVAHIAIVHALSQRRVEQACALARGALSAEEGADSGLVPPLRLLNARIPFWFNCDFPSVGALIEQASQTLDAYSATLASVRVADAIAGHNIDLMQLPAAREYAQAAADLAHRFDYFAQAGAVAYTFTRLRVAEREPLPEAWLAECMAPTVADRGWSRSRTFDLSCAAIDLTRRRRAAEVRNVLAELESHCSHLRERCPFDFPFVAAAVAHTIISGSESGRLYWNRYNARERVASYPPAPFTVALLEEFDLR